MEDNKIEQKKAPKTVDEIIREKVPGQLIFLLRQFFTALRSAWPKSKKEDH
jgi:hypothetical protein